MSTSHVEQKWVVVSLNGDSGCQIRVSNPLVPIPQGLQSVPDFATREEARSLIAGIDGNVWEREGFTKKRKVKRFSLEPDAGVDGPAMPMTLVELVSRFERTTGLRAQHVSVEQYPLVPSRYDESSSESVVTTFESRSLSEETDTTYFVAYLPLMSPMVQHLNCPQRRVPDCWTLKSPNHWTDMRMDPGTIYIKSGDSLWNWRSCVDLPKHCSQKGCPVLLKLSHLPVEETNSRSMSTQMSPVDSIDSKSACNSSEAATPHPLSPMPPLEDVLTIVVTTSPIQSHPSTELLERTFETFRLAGVEFAFKCRKVIVCDGCRLLGEQGGVKVSRKHTNVKQALRNGIATIDQVQNYERFKHSLRRLCQGAAADSPFVHTTVEELETRQGYGFALRHALEHCVKTKYVCVVQHDRTFMRETPVKETVVAMWNNSSNIKYVGMSMRSNLTYLDLFLSKYGKKSHDELCALIQRPHELELDAGLYGPHGSSIRDIESRVHGNVQKSIEQLALNYKGCSQCLAQQEWTLAHPPPAGRHQLSLTPTLFWYDNTHICESAHYRDFVFDPRLRMVARGGFVEDKLSPAIIRNAERFGLAAGHARFGCYLLDDHSGRFFTGHLDGGAYLTQEQKEEVGRKYNAFRLY